MAPSRDRSSRPTRLGSFWAGVLAALAGSAAGHLVAALTVPASSPVLAVGTEVINLTPTPVKTWAVRTLGSNDKPVLVGSVLVVTLVLAGVAGILASRRFAAGGAVLAVLVVLAGVFALVQPTAGVTDALPALVTLVVGLLVLAVLVRRRREPDQAAGPRTSGGPDGASRRGFLLSAGAVAAAAVVLGGAGELVIRARNKISDVVLPKPRVALAAQATGLEQRIPGVSPFVTKNSDFYRVDTNLTVPVVDIGSWKLSVDGDVARPFSLTFEELTKMDVVEHDITMTCVSNEVGGSLVGSARWLGVPLKDVLDRAGVGGRAEQILSTAVDGFTISTPLKAALDGRNTLVAFGMNGQPLPREHGFPVRLVTPGLYGFLGSTKWLTRLTLTTYAAQQAYWTRRSWATAAPIKLSSRIDTPAALSTIKAGATVIAGVAWAQPVGVAKVEVRIDGGAWQQARLGPDAGTEYWRQWYLPWKAASGSHMIAVRATNKRGDVQSPARVTPFPAGSSGIQETVVTVS